MTTSKKTRIINTNCPRCGTIVSSMAQPLSGAWTAFGKFRGVCGDCITPDETQEIMQAQFAGIIIQAQK